MATERATILYSGRVQGVGFRWSTIRVLQGMDLTGTVRNLPDGRVELILEGEPEELDRAAARVTAAMATCIGDEDHSRSPATGEFPDLRIAL